MKEQDWDTPGIEDLLVATRKMHPDEDGKYCFTATPGLWLLWAEITPEEDERGFAFFDMEKRAFV